MASQKSIWKKGFPALTSLLLLGWLVFASFTSAFGAASVDIRVSGALYNGHENVVGYVGLSNIVDKNIRFFKQIEKRSRQQLQSYRFF